MRNHPRCLSRVSRAVGVIGEEVVNGVKAGGRGYQAHYIHIISPPEAFFPRLLRWRCCNCISP